MMTIEELIGRMKDLETRYYALQAMYQELIHQHEELKRNPLKERYEDECG
jgi:hypothetical protein